MPSGYMFSDYSAWDFIADQLEAGHPYEEVTLHKPQGALALEMLIDLPNLPSKLYVKVEVGNACFAIGRSFHISYQ